jgi:hypothetical protein
MSSNQTVIVDFSIRTSIKDWFDKLVSNTFGSDVDIRYRSNDAHYSEYTHVEIRGGTSQIKEAIAFVRKTSVILEYKMPWLGENLYYLSSKFAKVCYVVILHYVG